MFKAVIPFYSSYSQLRSKPQAKTNKTASLVHAFATATQPTAPGQKRRIPTSTDELGKRSASAGRHTQVIDLATDGDDSGPEELYSEDGNDAAALAVAVRDNNNNGSSSSGSCSSSNPSGTRIGGSSNNGTFSGSSSSSTAGISSNTSRGGWVHTSPASGLSASSASSSGWPAPGTASSSTMYGPQMASGTSPNFGDRMGSSSAYAGHRSSHSTASAEPDRYHDTCNSSSSTNWSGNTNSSASGSSLLSAPPPPHLSSLLQMWLEATPDADDEQSPVAISGDLPARPDFVCRIGEAIGMLWLHPMGVELEFQKGYCLDVIYRVCRGFVIHHASLINGI